MPATFFRRDLPQRLDGWFSRLDAILAGEQAWISAIMFVLVLQVVLTVQHRPWPDEWQALQIAVQSPRLSDLMVNLRYEGHPPLWYLILRGVAAVCPDPAWALPLVALALAIPVQLAILLAAPFGRAERVMLALSEFVLFEYLTVSRSLTLGVAVMIAIAALWKRTRLVWLLIALLPLCDFLFGVISLGFAVMLWRERRIDWPLAMLWVIGGLFAAWAIRPAPDMVPALLPAAAWPGFVSWMAKMGALGLPLQWFGWLPRWNAPPPLPLRGLAFAGFFAVAWLELRKAPLHAWIFGLFIALLLVFNLAVYPLAVRHLALAAVLLIVLVWRVADDGIAQSVWWRAWLFALCVCGLFTGVIAISMPFDTAADAARMIDQMGLHDKLWTAYPHFAGTGVAAIDGVMFERLESHCSEDFIRWNAIDEHRVNTFDDLAIRLQAKVAQDGRFYLLSPVKFAEYPPLLHRIGHVSRMGYDGQTYFFYVVGQDHADAQPHNQPCNGPHLPLRHS